MDSRKVIKEIFPWQPEEISEKNKAKLSNFVDGEWVGSKTYKEVIDPLTGKPIILMPDTQVDELKPFLKSLAKCPKYGLHNPRLNIKRYPVYGEICFRAAVLLETKEIRDYFAQLINLVVPKGMAQCYGEVDIVIAFLKNFSGDNVRFLAEGRTTPGNRDGQEAVDYRWPYGPVAVISVFNFPIEIMAMQLLGALFMGNKPILKQSSLTSIVGEAFVRLLLHCGMPKEDMLLIHCAGPVMEKVITEGMPDPIVRFTQLTGDTRTFCRLSKVTDGRVKKEDSGFDWAVLGPNVTENKIDSVVNQCDKDAYDASGQKCSAESILFAHRNWIRAGLLEKLEELAEKRNLKDLSVGPILTWSDQQIQEHVDKLLSLPGAKLLFGGKAFADRHTIPECYGFYQPTAIYIPLEQIMPNFDLVTTEVFAPVQIITDWETREDLEKILAMCDKMDKKLTAGVKENDPDFINYVLRRTSNGTTYAGINARTTGAPQWHFFGPCGHPADAGIGTRGAIINVWSQQRTIIFDTDSGAY